MIAVGAGASWPEQPSSWAAGDQLADSLWAERRPRQSSQKGGLSAWGFQPQSAGICLCVTDKEHKKDKQIW